jgi:hypothetical protein
MQSGQTAPAKAADAAPQMPTPAPKAIQVLASFLSLSTSSSKDNFSSIIHLSNLGTDHDLLTNKIRKNHHQQERSPHKQARGTSNLTATSAFVGTFGITATHVFSLHISTSLGLDIYHYMQIYSFS